MAAKKCYRAAKKCIDSKCITSNETFPIEAIAFDAVLPRREVALPNAIAVRPTATWEVLFTYYVRTNFIWYLFSSLRRS